MHAPAAEQVAEAWRLSARRGWSVRRIGEHFGISKSAAANWVNRGREAESFLELLALGDDAERGLLGIVIERERMAAMMEEVMTKLWERHDPQGLAIEEISDHLLAWVKEYIRLRGLAAPARIAVEDGRAQPTMAPEVYEAIARAKLETQADLKAITERTAS
jgi:transcriptional regulator with XRE-family HTH domain